MGDHLVEESGMKILNLSITSNNKLSEDDDRKLYSLLSSNYVWVLTYFLRNFIGKEDVDNCAETLLTTTFMYAVPAEIDVTEDGRAIVKSLRLADENDSFFKEKDRSGNLIHPNKYEHVYSTNGPLTEDEFQKFLEEKKIEDAPQVITVFNGHKRLFSSQDDAKFEKIKKEIYECSHFQYFIPLVTFTSYAKVGHQNLILVNKQHRTITWIEPQYLEKDIMFEKRKVIILGFIKKLVDKLNLFK